VSTVQKRAGMAGAHRPNRMVRVRELRRQGVYLIPNLFTSGNLFCGVFAIISVFNAEYVTASMAILSASIFDVLDGKLARLTHSTSRFGGEYDSLADVISFGVAPGVLAYSWALGSLGRLGWAAVFLYIACGALRLARYNVQSASVERHDYVGLPIPAAAGLVAALVIFDDHILHFGKEVRPGLILGLIYVLAFLMVSTLSYQGVKGLRLKDRKPFGLLVGTLLVSLLFIVAPQIMLLACFGIYVLSGLLSRPISALYGAIRGNARSTPLIKPLAPLAKPLAKTR